MSYTKLPSLPGVYKDDTPLQANGYYIDADKVRFVRGVPQTMGGWELLTNTRLTGICRGGHSWVDSSLLQWLGFGTNTNLYGVNDSTVYDTTPVSSRGQLSSPFTTTISTTSVGVAHTAHGRAVGDGVSFSGASAVGGITVSGPYTVTTVVDANNYTITASSAATSSAGPGGGTVNYLYFLAIGLASATAALGFGTGAYSVGTYSSPSTGVFYARTWTFANYGGNMIACPRGGGIYEWNPLASTSPTELVLNGDFGSATGWTQGVGWLIGGNIATATVSMTGLTQTLVCTAAAYFVVQCDVTRSAGSMQISLGGNNVGTTVSASANVQRTLYGSNAGGSTTLAFTGTGFTGTVDNVTVKPLTTADLMTNAPTTNTCVVVTPDNFVMALGTVEVSTGLFNPLHIRWSDIAPNSHTWTPSSTNQSGFWTLGIGSRIVCAKCTNNEIIILTDKALYVGTYTNLATNPYVFRLVAQNCGAIGAQCLAILGGTAYWMSNTGYWFRYSGGGAEPMQSTIRAHVMDNIAFVQQDKIFGSTISSFQDAIWFYPDQRDGTNECSRYALCDTQEPAPLMGAGPPPNIGVWAPGTFDRTTWIDAGIFQYPIAVDSSGYIYYQEKGQTANGGTFSWSLETAAYELGSGDTLYVVDTFIPDFETLVGGCTYTAYSYKYPQSTPVGHQFMILPSDEMIGLLSDAPLGRQIAHKFEGSASPCAMRGGAHQMDIDDTGMEF